MRPSLFDARPLPETWDEFQSLQSEGLIRHPTCCDCRQPFSPENVQSAPGWRESQISGFCETCFDNLFLEGDEE